ncbi:hypothetical protein IW140_006453, partial [Coemansia sp. RSA 1813]
MINILPMFDNILIKNYEITVTGLQNLLNFYSSNCQDITQFYVNGNIVGASFAGQMIQNHAFAVVVIQKLIDEVKANGISSSKFIQYCPGDPAKSFGVILDTTGNISALRSYVKSWSKGRCVSSSGTSSVTLNTWSVSWLGKSGNAVADPNLPTCDYVRVVSGQDTATACGITGDAIQLYNPGVNFNNLQPGQPVCCSVGKPPDLRPKPNADATFINTYNLDGVDFDWEYPGATDMPGVGGRGPNDGSNYLKFLIYLKSIIPPGKTMSIAAPAGYWYLKNFPIAEMSSYLDYIVYMTYDLHGQWDYTIPSTGPYLRSHVNLTETIDSLVMITKAGVPSNKILVGIGSYGRSFRQTDPNCSEPTCTFTGPESGATP